MIRNIEKLSNQIVDWLRDCAKRANRSTFIVLGAPNLATEATITLCKRAGVVYISHSDATRTLEAEEYNGIIVGTLIREQVFARTYHKYGSGLADIFPLGDLYFDEILQLHSYKPDNDLKLRDIPIELIKWADRENNLSNIITAEERPETSRVWFRYTLPQKEAISKLHQFEKLTRHKRLVQPIFPARTSEFVQ